MILELDSAYFMKKAIDQAQIALAKGEVPIGAIIVMDNKIIATGHNLTETLNDVTAHAEMLAITAAANYIGGKFLHDCTLYVTLEPCQMCAGALNLSQISKVSYSSPDLKSGFNSIGTKIHPKTIIEQGVLRDETSEILSNFFREKRKLN